MDLNLVEIGKKLSAANRAKIQAAMEALQEILTATEDATEARRLLYEAAELSFSDKERAVRDAIRASLHCQPGNGQVTLGTPANVGEAKKTYKTEDGKQFPASDFAYVPDPEKPSTWKLRLTAEPGGSPDAGIVGAAAAALGPGFRGQKVDIPAADLAAVKAKVRAAWRKANPNKEDSLMPSGIKESNGGPVELIGDVIPLVEAKAVNKDGIARVRIISPGQGTSGYYPGEVLQKAAPLFANVQTFWDHPTASEEAERPERSLRDLAGKIVGTPAWEANGPAGPGIYADVQVFEPYRQAVQELAPHIGMSIRATGRYQNGEAEGKKTRIITGIESVRSVDFVTQAGRGGEVLQLFEAARGGQAYKNTKEDQQVTDQEEKALREALAAAEAKVNELTEARAVLTGENARLREALLLREARDFVGAELAKVENLPDLTKTRLAESLAAKPVVKDGQIDREAYATAIQEAANAEAEYLAKVTGQGQIRGMGTASRPADGQVAVSRLRESYKILYRAQGMSEAEAERLAELAAGS